MTVGVQFPALPRPALAAGGFTATRWHSADEKARMGDAILAFIARGMPRSGWTMSLYNRLSNMFGFIAHYAEGSVMRSSGRRVKKDPDQVDLDPPYVHELRRIIAPGMGTHLPRAFGTN